MNINSSPLVSIITPYFDTGSVFLETALSVCKQTLKNFEWIIVDDASSSPETNEVLTRCVEKFNFLNVLLRIVRHETNEGLSAARNTGVKEAKGEFVMFLDSDDILEPTCLEKYYWKLKTHPELSFVGSWTVGFGAQNYLWKQGFNNGSYFLKENLTTATVMLRKELFERVGGFDQSRRGGLEDWDFWLRCASIGYWGDTIPEPLNKYRRRETHSDRWTDFNVTGIKNFLKSLPQKYPNLNEKTFPRPVHVYHVANQNICMKIPIFPQIYEKKKKKLLMIVPHFEMGGADRWNLDFLKYLTKTADWEVTLVTTNAASNRWEEHFLEITKDIHILSNFLTLPDYPRYLRYLIQTRQPDIVCISNSHLGYALAPALHAYFPDIPFVDYVHMEEENYRSGGYAMDSVRHRETLAMTGVTSNHLRNWMLLREKNASRVKTIYINVNTEYWKQNDAVSKKISDELKISEEQIVILYACRFVAQKQPDVLIATVERVLEKTKSVVFLIAGDGPERGIIQSLVKKYPQNIRYLGPQPSEKIGELLNASDMAFLPSEMEGIALFFYEAMSMSVVPVGANVGGQAELVTPECGVLIEKKPKEDEAIEYANVILKLSSKLEMLSEMKKQSRQRVENLFRTEQMGKAMLAMFEQAVIENKKETTMSEALAESYISEVIEQFRLANLAEELWTSQSKQAMNDQFRNSRISPKFSKTKRNILRFLMKNL